jgi:hypothetical protein
MFNECPRPRHACKRQYEVENLEFLDTELNVQCARPVLKSGCNIQLESGDAATVSPNA